MCVRCGAKAIEVPTDYDGRFTLWTNTFTKKGGWRDVLILDHILTRKAGGQNRVENLQTLCETCNRRKVAEDKEAARQFQERGK
jgi:5-methylcytosine-specific restriction endonuclease McrA